MRPIAVFLCDKTGIMAEPWAEAGVECYCVDVQHSIRRERVEGLMHFVWGDARSWTPPEGRIHKARPTDDRADIRSATPRGFARAVFEANYKRRLEVAA